MSIDFNALDRRLRDSVQDLVLAADEKVALRELGGRLDADRIRYMRNRAFDLAREAIQANLGDTLDALRWLEQVIKTLDASGERAPIVSSAFFSPGETCLRKLRELIGSARTSIDVCVFTIADNRLSDELIAAHKRGIALRILSDNDKQHDAGSDINQIQRSGIPVRLDNSPYHMHHKFAVFDGRLLANGSFNWTRSATVNNDENLVVTDDANLMRMFANQFEILWKRFA